jgi:hypothetical protein
MVVYWYLCARTSLEGINEWIRTKILTIAFSMNETSTLNRRQLAGRLKRKEMVWVFCLQ